MSTNPNPRPAYRTRTTDQPSVEDDESSTTGAPHTFAPTGCTMPELFDTEAEYTER